jgi:hypothetical protein
VELGSCQSELRGHRATRRCGTVLLLREVGLASEAISAAVVLAVSIVMASARVAAQSQASPVASAETQGVLPDASFELLFRKYMPPNNRFSPFYYWDAHLDLDLTVFRKGPGAINISTVMQTIGTENLGSRVSVGAAGYILGFGYVHTRSRDLVLSAGMTHLSSHLTRDLDDKLDEERAADRAIPVVADPSEYNVFFLKAYRRFSGHPIAPELEVAVEPVTFTFDGQFSAYARPLYVRTGWTLWRGRQKTLKAETDHEVGENPFNRFFLVLDLYASEEREGRLQIFVSASPGRDLHVSPNIGASRDGMAFGIRTKFST